VPLPFWLQQFVKRFDEQVVANTATQPRKLVKTFIFKTKAAMSAA